MRGDGMEGGERPISLSTQQRAGEKARRRFIALRAACCCYCVVIYEEEAPFSSDT